MYKIPFTINTPINPSIKKWEHTIPEKYRTYPDLMDFLLRLGSYAIENNHFNEGVNPLYKIIEMLGADKLYYSNLEVIKEYYNIDLITYLTQQNLAELYVGASCLNAEDLKKALSEKNNKTNDYTLASILRVLV